MDDVPCRKDDFEAEDVVARGPVLDRAHARRVADDHAPNRARFAASRAGREPEAVLRESRVELVVYDPRLDDAVQVLYPYLLDLVHQGEIDYDPAFQRHGVSAHRSASPPGDDRRPRSVCELDYLGDLFRVDRPD